MQEFFPYNHDRERGFSDQVIEKDPRRAVRSGLVYNARVSVIHGSYPFGAPLLRETRTTSVGSLKAI